MNRREKEAYLELLIEKEKRIKAESVNCSGLSRLDANKVYDEIFESDNRAAMRRLCKTDLFFLCTRAFKRKDMDHDWLYDRCREVEAAPDECLDLWAREHYKSTVITYALSIKDILSNPEVLIGIFSHTRPNAKGFLDQIKRELEQNQFLKDLFPDVLYQHPQAESPKWSLDSGIIVKRKTNPKESTVEAHGVVDGQPTGKHFTVLVYDDVVTQESVSTTEQINKTTKMLELSYNLGAKGGARRFIGTRYHANDSYKVLLDRGTATPRIKAATHDGTMDGEPVFLDKESLMKKRRDQGPFTFSSQMLQNPTADKSQGFKEEWLKFYRTLKDISTFNKYILVDPASEKKKTSDYTTMWVLGLAPDKNYYVIDCIRDRLNLTQKSAKLFELHRKYNPLKVAYEKYGMQSDIEHIKYEMEIQNYRFNIQSLGGSQAKADRIRMLVPVFEQGRMWLPERMSYVDHESRQVDLVRSFIDDEFSSFPVSTHDDMLDCMARILDPELNAQFPAENTFNYSAYGNRGGGDNGWMGA